MQTNESNEIVPMVFAGAIACALLASVTVTYTRSSRLRPILRPTTRRRILRSGVTSSSPRIVSRMRVERPLSVSLLVPLEYDADEGAYMMRLGIGRGLVSCVLDSGSAHITVKGSSCQWTNCYVTETAARKKVMNIEGGKVSRSPKGEYCILRPCPCGRDRFGRWLSDCHDRSYTPSAGAEALRGGGLSRELAYGSQTNTVDHFLETISVMDAKGVAHALQSAVVYQITKVDGDTSSNIVGMTMELRPSNTHNKTFLGAVPTTAWTCELLDANPVLDLFGNSARVPPDAVSLPLIDIANERGTKGLAKSNVLFYTTRLLAIGVTHPDQTTEWWEDDNRTDKFPRYVVFDTGTTNSYSDDVLGPELRRRLHWREVDGEVLHFRFEDGKTLSWRFQDMIDPDGVPGVTRGRVSALHCENKRTYPGFREMFYGTYFIMIGIRMMRNRAWRHDIGNMTLQTWALT